MAVQEQAQPTTEQREQWRALIATLETLLRLHHHRAGTLTSLAEYLYQRSAGMIGSLSQLIRGGSWTQRSLDLLR